MDKSPLEFAQEFEKFKSALSRIQTEDAKILLLTDFWPTIKEKTKDHSYQSYLEEFYTFWQLHLNQNSLSDLTLDELTRIIEALQDLHHYSSGDNLTESINMVLLKLASLYFFAGDIDNGLKQCCKITGDLELHVPEAISDNLDAYTAFIMVCDYIKGRKPGIHCSLMQIRNEWDTVRDAYYFDQLFCLFVEKTDGGRSVRGRMRLLKGSVDCFNESATTDEITFDNQIKTPDDPFVGVTYEALKAVRSIFKNLNHKIESSSFYHAHFAIQDSEQTFTGNSIGFAAGLLAYIQLLRPDNSRVDRFLSAEVACTGGIDKSGQITKVNDGSLEHKVRRAFFSPIKYLVLPKENQLEADKILDGLYQKYPRRKMIIIYLNKFGDAIENHNIIRDEKVCIGEYVTKKAIKYSRAAKIQIPLLLMLLYAMICVIYPKAWIGFDRNPQYVQPTETGFVALNADSVALWEEGFNECGQPHTIYSEVFDINGDEKNEVLIHPFFQFECECRTMYFCYDWSGKEMYKRSTVILDQYPGDTLGALHISGKIYVRLVDSIPLIITESSQSNPSRQHIKIWNQNGDSIAWYINAGATELQMIQDFDSDNYEELLFSGINNRLGCAVLFVLEPNGTYGVSPPYHDDFYDLSNVLPGNQLIYLQFPISDVGQKRLFQDYNIVAGGRIFENRLGIIDIPIVESDMDSTCNVIYSFNRNLKLESISFTDQFQYLREKLINNKVLSNISDYEYKNTLFNEVKYWKNNQWISAGEFQQ